mmetsp:Transcript_18/g.23  ORF Transcript_18/g.23 Transcript_18/m.23 type:complete len:275 (-) Transcript_18:289-1113(-)
MSNIHGLFSSRRDNSDEEREDGNDDNNRYVGGVSARGGGSGLAVEPNPIEGSSHILDSVRARAASASDGPDDPLRRVITMYRNGFTVDDGPYRRLDDPANSDFLNNLARGRTPRELYAEGDTEGNVVVGLMDKRHKEYDESEAKMGKGNAETGFQSFSGAGNSLGSISTETISDQSGIISPLDANSPPPQPTPQDTARPCTSIQVRLLCGKRIVVKVNLDNPVSIISEHILASGNAGDEPFVLSSGFPPKIITDFDQTIEEAGLKGAQVTQKKA